MLRITHKIFLLVACFLFSAAYASAEDVEFDPVAPRAGQPVTVIYKGFLRDQAVVVMHWGYDGYKAGANETDMSKQQDGFWKATVIVPAEATNTFDAVFHNRGGWWDNNRTADYHALLDSDGTLEVNKLGAAYTPEATTFAIWSPDTSNVVLNLAGKDYPCRKVRNFSRYTDIYAVTIPGDHKLKEYQFKINGTAVRDPYGVMVKSGTNLNIVMDLDAIQPEGGWVAPPELVDREDTIVYEVHIRDFTIDSNSGVAPEKRGKFLGMVETGTNYQGLATGIDHLKELGITHVQLLPFYDFATTHYNWGYDPINFNVPEDQYSLTPDDYENRVREVKTMINEFHKNGIRVIMDVVYNHTFTDETFENISRKYYTGNNDSGTGNGINTAVPMVSRFIQDSLEFWVDEYHVDGFRFDLMGIFHYDEVRKWGEYLNQHYPDRHLVMYGEPWNGFFADPVEYRKVRLGNVAAIATGRMGVFNPKYREVIKGDSDACRTKGYMFNGNVSIFDVKVGSRGGIRFSKGQQPLPNLWDQMFAYDPEQSINYISAHDNLCLWDKIKFCGEENEYGKRIARFGMGMVLTSQGIPFIHAGDEMLRTKVYKDNWQFAKNSYNAPDEFNMIRWDWKAQNKKLFEYFKDLIALRRDHPGFRLNSWDEIDAWMDTTTDGKVVVSQIDADRNGDTWDEILVVYNSGNRHHIALPDGDWTKVFDITGAVNEPNLTGRVPCEGTAVTVFAKGEIDNPPIVDIEAPRSTVRDEVVKLRSTASDDKGVARVEFYLDEQKIGEDRSAPYELEFRREDHPDGTHTVGTVVYDTQNQTAETKAQITLGEPLDTAPVIRELTVLPSPATATTTISAEASDDREVTKVEFYLGTVKLGEDMSAPYKLPFDSTRHVDGDYTVKAIAYDGAAQMAEATLPTTIQNQGIRVCFKKPESWAQAYGYAWIGAGQTPAEKLRGPWPGKPMVAAPAEGDNWYCDVFAGQTKVNLVFNDNGRVKTEDVSTYRSAYYKEGQWTPSNPEGDRPPSVSATPAGAQFKDTVHITLRVDSGATSLLTSTYALDSDTPIAFKHGDSLTLGADMAEGERKTLRLCATNQAGETCEEYLFTKTSSAVASQRFSWDNATVYFVLTDRFLDASPANNHSYGRELNQAGNPYPGYQDKIATFKGGDLRGLIQKLNEGYFTELGVNAIWLSSPLEQIHGWVGGENFRHYAYHGYYVMDPTELDANLGTKADFKEFVDTAHAKGIRVILDVVLNHTGYYTLKDMHDLDFGQLNPGWQEYYYNQPEQAAHYNTYGNYVGKTSNARWANWWGSQWIREDLPGYAPCGGDDLTQCLSGLPDIKTASLEQVNVPSVLLRKWDDAKEAQERAELDAFFARTGKPRNPRNYMIKWLTDWVREYGIDGFRADTVKHVGLDAWKDLKEEANAALAEWKAANPAKTLDNEQFWMTGEVWGHGAEKSHYFSNGAFDSIINFSFQESAGHLSAMPDIYRGYADSINGDPSFNLLTYISSHDKGLGGRHNLIDAGTSLLLLPGGVQIFYGDETGRPRVDRPWMEHGRSRMNWDSIDQSVLAHWQKLGQFRNRHVAIGAGEHQTIPSTNGFAFSRVYDQDRVACVIQALGSTAVTVASLFNDGTEVRNYYTGDVATVRNGQVTFDAHSVGVILIEATGPTDPPVSAGITVHYRGWSKPNLYAWLGEANPLTGPWPGIPMEEEGNGWYRAHFPQRTHINLIFNTDGGSKQTSDLAIGAGEWWYKDGKWTAHNPEDSESPKVSIVTPVNDSIHTGTVTVTVEASDNVGVDKIEFYYGEKKVGESIAAPYALQWNTALVPNGTDLLKALAHDLAGNTAESQPIRVATQNENLPPVADAGPDIRSSIGTTVRFDASKSYDPNGTIASYQWSNGLSGVNPTKVYDQEGSYLVELMVTDNEGATDKDEVTIVVTEQPLRSDFREESIYFVITSRFYDGDPSNNAYCWDGKRAGNIARQDPCWRGDFKGLIEKLDYIKALGFSAIWITPVVKNASGYDYHGYHAVNFQEVDPRYESPNYDYQRLIDEAHARGIKVVQDVVFNHTSNFGEENLFPLFTKDRTQPDLPENLIKIAPPGLLPDNYDNLLPEQQFQARIMAMKEDENDTRHIYHHEKSLQWEGYTVQTGQIAGDAVDLNTENPIVYNYLVDAYGKYIDMGVDAFRVDTVKHISRLTFNKVLIPPLKQRGGENFYLFGEVAARYRQIWNNDIPSVSVPFYTWKESKNYLWGERITNEGSTLQLWEDNINPAGQPTSDNHKLHGNRYHSPDWSKRSHLDQIDFPMHWNFKTAREAFHLALSTDQFYNDATWNVTYVDSHDYAPDTAPENQRFAGSEATWAENLSLMFNFRGIPCLYYGSEIEFQKGKVIDVGPNKPLAETGRAYFGDHLEGDINVSDFGVYSNPTGAMAETLQYPLAKHVQRLNRIRRAIPALQKGQYSTEGVDGGGMAFKRRYTKTEEEVDSLVLVTISGAATFSGIPGGTYVDAITGKSIDVNEGGSLSASVSGAGNLRVYVLNGPGKIGKDTKYLH